MSAGLSAGAIAGISAGVSAAGTIASTAMSASGGSSAAQGAAGISAEAARLGIDELHNALGPSMARLDKAQAWSDRQLKRQYQRAMGETARYADAGARGLGRLNYLMGLDNGLGPQPTAPTAPKAPKPLKPPKYDKDPKKAAIQKAQYDKAVAAQAKQYKKDTRAYNQAKTKFDTDSAAWTAGTAAAGSDPEFGSMMKPYDDRFEGRIDAAGQNILNVAGEKYNDKYAQEILDTARDKFEAEDFEADPGYEFRRSEGGRGVEQGASARGSLLSGAALKELTRFNQDTASNEFDRAHGRWADQRDTHLAGVKGQQGFDYGVWDANKGARLGALSGERDALFNMRNFDFGNFTDNRDFQYGALNDMVDVGQDATDDRNQNRQFYGTARTQNALANATQQGNWQQNNAAAIAELIGQSGNAQAAGLVGAQNAQTNAFQTGANSLTALAGYYYGGNNRRGTYAPGDRRGGDAPIRNIYPR